MTNAVPRTPSHDTRGLIPFCSCGLSLAAKVSRPRRPPSVSRVREEGAGGGFECVAVAGRLSGAGVGSDATGVHHGDRSSIPRKERRRVGGNSRRRSPRGLGSRAGPVTPSPPRSYAAAVKEMSLGRTRPALSRTFWPVDLIPSNARQEDEPAICLSQSVQYQRDKPNVKAKQSQGA